MGATGPAADATAVLEDARAAFDARSWRVAYEGLTRADGLSPLALEDLERLALAAYLSGQHDAIEPAWVRAHHECLRLGDSARAARCAFSLGMELMLRGEQAQGGGWLARAHRLVEEAPSDCAERGYLLMAGALQQLMSGDAEAAYPTFCEAAAIAARCNEADLAAFCALGRGQALVAMGQVAEGVAFYDEVMVSVTADEISPLAAGIVYCSVIASCHSILDLRRAQEWTEALSRWCADQQDLVPYRGQCLVHRAELMQLHGRWSDAMGEVTEACTHLAGHPAQGAAYYTKAEIHRLRGEFAEAEQAYLLANQAGRHPQPGLALLRLAQGRLDDAEGAVRGTAQALGSGDGALPASPGEATAVAAYIEVALAVGDPMAAEAAADRLATLAERLEAPTLRALADQAKGAVLIATGEPAAALSPLERARSIYAETGARYEVARVQALAGTARRALGDEDTAQMELQAAAAVFRELGASPDLSRVERILNPEPAGSPGGLSPREIEVLELVAAGNTNRAIAERLVISEKTVARHMSNLFTKLGVGSRAAATAYAYEHGLVAGSDRSR